MPNLKSKSEELSTKLQEAEEEISKLNSKNDDLSKQLEIELVYQENSQRKENFKKKRGRLRL